MTRFLIFVMGLLYYRTNGTCADIATMLGTLSHDSLTRFLKAEWSGQKRQELILRALTLLGGYLVIDDTPDGKPYAHTLEGLGYVYSTKDEKVIHGYCTVLLVWISGVTRIPISLRLYNPGGKTKIELALEMLSYARNQLGLKPEFVIFDTWYAGKAIFKRLADYGWYFVTRIKSNRKFDGIPLKKIAWRPYWSGIGKLTGGIKVFVVKNGDKFFATNRLSLIRDKVLAIYRIRPQIEEVHRVLKQECCFGACQIDSFKAQEHHRWCAVFAFTVLELERESHGTTIYKLRKMLIHRGSTVSIPYFDKLLSSA